MSLEYSLCPQSTVYVPSGPFKYRITVYVLRVQFMSIEYSLRPQSIV